MRRMRAIFLIAIPTLLACGDASKGGPGTDGSSSGNVDTTSAPDSDGATTPPAPEPCTDAADSTTGVSEYDDAAIFVLETTNANLCYLGDEIYRATAWEVCAVENKACAPYRYAYFGDEFSCLDGAPPATMAVVAHNPGDYVVGWYVVDPVVRAEGVAYGESWQCFQENSLDRTFHVTEDDYNDVTTFVLSDVSEYPDDRTCVQQCVGGNGFGPEGCSTQ
jgi:hypothetical protein